MKSWHRNLRDIGWSLGATRNEGLGPTSICSAPNWRLAPTRPEAPTTLEARKRFSDQRRPPDQNANTEGRGRSTTANHTNQVVLITGGASGIGKATAMKLAAKGVTVVISGRREAIGAVAVKEIEGVARDDAQVRFVRNDVTDESAVKAMIDQIVSEFGRLDM